MLFCLFFFVCDSSTEQSIFCQLSRNSEKFFMLSFLFMLSSNYCPFKFHVLSSTFNKLRRRRLCYHLLSVFSSSPKSSLITCINSNKMPRKWRHDTKRCEKQCARHVTVVNESEQLACLLA